MTQGLTQAKFLSGMLIHAQLPEARRITLAGGDATELEEMARLANVVVSWTGSADELLDNLVSEGESEKSFPMRDIYLFNMRSILSN